MLRRAPFFALLFTAAPALGAQFDTVDESWARVRSNQPLEALQPIEVEAAPDGGVLVIGLARGFPIDDFNAPAEVVLAKLDENGDLEWTDSVATAPATIGLAVGGRYADAVVDAQGEWLVVLQRVTTSVLRRYGADGTLLWSIDLPLRAFPGTGGWHDYKAMHVALAPSGDIVVGGASIQSSYPRVEVRTFAPDGTPRWEWRGNGGVDFASNAQGFPVGLAVGPNGIIYAYGRSDIPGIQHGARVIAVDSAGSFLWRHDEGFSSTPFAGLVFDSQGRATVAVSRGTANGWSATAVKLDANGTVIFTADNVVASSYIGVSSIAIDAFDRIVVGGSRRPSTGILREASLFRFDANGTPLGYVVPSVVGPGEDGVIHKLAVTPRNDVIAFGMSGTGSDEIMLARFAPDGSERWALKRRGARPSPTNSGSVELGLTVDPRGNLFTLAEVRLAGVFPNLALGLDVVKHVQNGPAGTSYCSPAPTNSTGAPAELSALGPSSLAADNVTLRADQLPPGALTLFITSRTQGNTPNAGGGQGTICLGGAVGRFYGPGQIRVAGDGGSAALQLHLGELPQPTGSVAALLGETWNFQAWYRDANPAPTSNLTDGISITIQ